MTTLRSTGVPGNHALERNVQVALEGNADAAVDRAEAFSADPTHWEAPLPSTQDEALTRMAALLFTLNSGTKIP